MSGAVRVDSGNVTVRGAVVTLLTAAGIPTDRRTITDEHGRYSLLAPRSGVFLVEVRAIGFQPGRSTPVSLGAGETKTLDVSLTLVTTRLAGLNIGGHTLCRRAEQLEPVARQVWDDIWTALASLDISQSDLRSRTEAFVYRRNFDAETGLVHDEDRLRIAVMNEKPFHAVSPEDLDRLGFWHNVGGRVDLYAPDAATLISDPFLRGHCFTLVKDSTVDPPRVGLSFRPVHFRAHDVEGVLWVDPVSRELRSLEYQYTGLPVVADRIASGRMSFTRLGDGPWVDDDWFIQFPYERYLSSAERWESDLALLVHAAPQTSSGKVALVHEGGGFILNDSSRAWRFSTVDGRITRASSRLAFDSATIEFLGTTVHSTIDSNGSFRVPSVLPGTYEIRVQRDGASESGGFVEHAVVTLAGGLSDPVDLAVRPDSVTERALCPGWRPSRGTTPLFAVVRERATGFPVASYEVVMEWTAPSDSSGRTDRQKLLTDWRGEAVACNVPAGSRVRIGEGGSRADAWSPWYDIGAGYYVADVSLGPAAPAVNPPRSP